MMLSNVHMWQLVMEDEIGWPRKSPRSMPILLGSPWICSSLTAKSAKRSANVQELLVLFVQFHKNSSLHSGIQRSPYTAMFGCEAKVGSTTSSLPTEIVERMQTEDDLLSAMSISSQENVQVNSEQMETSVDIEALYTICVKSGILKGTFARNQFDICPQALLQESDVNHTRTVTLRAAVSEESASGGQGFIRCNCAGSNKCQSNRCKCFKSKMKCSSRCHNSLSCKNK